MSDNKVLKLAWLLLLVIGALSELVKAKSIETHANGRVYTVTCRAEECLDALSSCSSELYGDRCLEHAFESFPTCIMCIDELVNHQDGVEIDGIKHIYCDSNDHLQLLTCSFYCQVNGYRDGGVCVKQDRLPICKCLNTIPPTIDLQTQTEYETTETSLPESSPASTHETVEPVSSTNHDGMQATSEETSQTSETSLELLTSTPVITTTEMLTLPLLTLTKSTTTKRVRTTTTSTSPSTTTHTSTTTGPTSSSSIDPTTLVTNFTDEESTSGSTSTPNIDSFDSSWPISCRNYFCEASLRDCVRVYKCLGSNCKACVYNHYNSCAPCADAVLDERVTVFAQGSEQVLCEQEDIIHVYACSLYCRYRFYTDGICLLKDSLPICQCQN